MTIRNERGGRRRALLWLALSIGVLSVLWAVFASARGGAEEAIASRLTAGEFRTQGFLRASPGRVWAFPRDHGPHEDYQTEWWYFTGNLGADTGARFGYQLTFFRRALTAPPDRMARDTAWATDQVYFAHFTLTDVQNGNHRAFERFSREAVGLAGARSAPFQVWLEDWEVREVGPDRYALTAAAEDLSLNLTLTDLQGPILHGQDGYSPKGPLEGNASYYYSLTDLRSNGVITTNGESFQVQGKSWMDHEFSTSALGPDQIGWDWFSIQLEDGTEIMLFQIRKADGSIDPVSSGTVVSAQGSVTPLDRAGMQIEVLESWQSPQSGATYPAAWTIRVPAEELALTIEPLIADQELNVSFTYWEGAVRVEGEQDGRPVTGFGYVEMTGYAESIAGKF